MNIPNPGTVAQPGKRRMKRDKDAVVRDLIAALSLCHNVTPIYNSETNEKSYQASSPDEIALVKLAESMGMCLHKRTQAQITLKTPQNREETYEIKANFPFSSESKRMGILLRQVETDRYMFYLKGADTVMKQKIPEF